MPTSNLLRPCFHGNGDLGNDAILTFAFAGSTLPALPNVLVPRCLQAGYSRQLHFKNGQRGLSWMG